MATSSSNKRSRNCGIDILRVIMCYNVIISHFGQINPNLPAALYDFLGSVRQAHVPVFMFISFYLMAPIFTPPPRGPMHFDTVSAACSVRTSRGPLSIGCAFSF